MKIENGSSVRDDVDIGKSFKDFQVKMASDVNGRQVHIAEDTRAIFALGKVFACSPNTPQTVY